MSKRDIAIIGTGGMAREVRWVIEESKNNEQWNILGWVSKEKPGTLIAGLPVLGDDDWLLERDKPIDVVVSVGSGALRKKIVSYLKQNPNISFPSIIADSAEVSNYVRIGEGAIIMNKSLLTVDITVGDFFLCNYGCTVGHDCRFEDYVTLNPGARLSGGVHVCEGATIGVGASIKQQLKIGKESFVGAGAVVVKDVDDNITVVGVPAKILEKR